MKTAIRLVALFGTTLLTFASSTWGQTTLPQNVLGFAATTYTVGENEGSVSLEVERTGGSAGAISVDYSETDISAVAGVAYQATNGTLTWADGDASNKTITIPIVARGLEDNSRRNFFVVLTNASNGASLGTSASATVLIFNNPRTFTTLYRFAGGTDGAIPTDIVQGQNGNFYGTTLAVMDGGFDYIDHGTFFLITPAGVLTTLYNFTNGADGMPSVAGLAEGSDGNFYGTSGRPNNDGRVSGTVFSITPAGVVTNLYSLGSGVPVPEDALVQGSDGNFYGTTREGGTSNSGTIFSITPAGVVTILYSFSALDSNYTNSDGAGPHGLIQASDGNFYGTTAIGGSSDSGTAFRMTPAGMLTTIYTFGAPDGDDNNSGGIRPSDLIQGVDGKLYGTTQQGGAGGEGTVFAMSLDGHLTTLHDFALEAPYPDGQVPVAGLCAGSDGNFYGTTSVGGVTGSGPRPGSAGGTIFQITPGGVLTVLLTFDTFYDDDQAVNTNGGARRLIQGLDGNLYGTTKFGGTDGNGTIFKLAVPSLGLIPTVTLTTAGDGLAEEGGEKGRLVVRRTGGPATALTVRYKIQGSAKAGLDYKPLSGSVTIPNGATQAKITIKPLNDTAFTGTRLAKITLLPATDGSYVLGTPTLAKIKVVSAP